MYAVTTLQEPFQPGVNSYSDFERAFVPLDSRFFFLVSEWKHQWSWIRTFINSSGCDNITELLSGAAEAPCSHTQAGWKERMKEGGWMSECCTLVDTKTTTAVFYTMRNYDCRYFLQHSSVVPHMIANNLSALSVLMFKTYSSDCRV